MIVAKPIMQFDGIDIFQLRDVEAKKNMVRLTKWLPATNQEFGYLAKEYGRIREDATRQCVIVYWCGKVALYVNDITEGAFDRMGDENET